MSGLRSQKPGVNQERVTSSITEEIPKWRTRSPMSRQRGSGGAHAVVETNASRETREGFVAATHSATIAPKPIPMNDTCSRSHSSRRVSRSPPSSCME